MADQSEYQDKMSEYHVKNMTDGIDPATKEKMNEKVEALSREFHGELLYSTSEKWASVQAEQYLNSQAENFKKKDEETENENSWRIILAKMLEWMLEHIFMEKVKKRRYPKETPRRQSSNNREESSDETAHAPTGAAQSSENYRPPTGGGPDDNASPGAGGQPGRQSEEYRESYASTQDYGRAVMSLGYNVNHDYSFDAHGALQEHQDKVDDLRVNDKTIDDVRGELRERIEERTDYINNNPEETKYFNSFDRKAGRAGLQEMQLADDMLSRWEDQGIRADEVDEEEYEVLRTELHHWHVPRRHGQEPVDVQGRGRNMGGRGLQAIPSWNRKRNSRYPPREDEVSKVRAATGPPAPLRPEKTPRHGQLHS